MAKTNNPYITKEELYTFGFHKKISTFLRQIIYLAIPSQSLACSHIFLMKSLKFEFSLLKPSKLCVSYYVDIFQYGHKLTIHI